jgi:hypothetical protein
LIICEHFDGILNRVKQKVFRCRRARKHGVSMRLGTTGLPRSHNAHLLAAARLRAAPNDPRRRDQVTGCGSVATSLRHSAWLLQRAAPGVSYWGSERATCPKSCANSGRLHSQCSRPSPPRTGNTCLGFSDAQRLRGTIARPSDSAAGYRGCLGLARRGAFGNASTMSFAAISLSGPPYIA